MSLKKRFLKSRPVCQVTFRLPLEAASQAKEVVLLGDFNNWDQNNGFPMKKTKTYFTTTIDLKPDQIYEFRYLIDGQFWENDWEADRYVESPMGVENSVVVTKNMKNWKTKLKV